MTRTLTLSFLAAVLAGPAGAGVTPPTIERLDPDLLAEARARVDLEFTDPDPAVWEDVDRVRESDRADPGDRGGGTVPDNDAVHYARGTTLILHFFINPPSSSFTASEKYTAYARSDVAREYYTSEAPLGANLSFDDGVAVRWETTISTEIVDRLTEEQWNEACNNVGIYDWDADGRITDDASFWLQTWNGGWDNVILAVQPHEPGRAFAGYYDAFASLFLDSTGPVWAHEFGHLFGACDEYAEDGTCNGGLDCNICQSWYLWEDVPNENCALATCGVDVPCLMKYNDLDALCEWTPRHWAWADDNSDGLLNPVKRNVDESTVAAIWEVPHGGYFYWNDVANSEVMSQRWNSWSVVGVRSPATADYDLTLYGENNHRMLLAASATGAPVDFLVGDYNHSRPGNEHIQITRFSGAADSYNLSFESGEEMLFANGDVTTHNWSMHNVVRAWDVPLFAGETLQFELDHISGDADFDMALYRSNGAMYFASQFDAEWYRDTIGAAAGEVYTYTVPADDVYGLVVWSRNAADGQFTLQIGPSEFPLPEEYVHTETSELSLYSYAPNANAWAVAGCRPAAGVDASLAMFDESTYETQRQHSDTEGPGGVELIVIDYRDGYSTDYLRRRLEDGWGPISTNWEHGADVLGGIHTYDWPAGQVVKVWDVPLAIDQPYYFRQYNTSADLDAGTYLFGNAVAIWFQTKDDARAQSDFRPPTDLGEWFSYTPLFSSDFAYVMTENSGAGGEYTIVWGPRFTLEESVPATTSESNVMWTIMPVTTAGWSAVGMRSSPGENCVLPVWDCAPSSGSCYQTLDFQGTGVSIVASDHNHLGPRNLYPRPERLWGAVGPFTASFEDGAEKLVFDPMGVDVTGVPWTAAEVVQIWDLFVDGSVPDGQGVEIEVEIESGGLDLGLVFFSSAGQPLYQGSASAMARVDAAGSGASEVMSVTVTDADWYGVAVFSNDDSSGSYSLHVREPGMLSLPETAHVTFGLSMPRNPFPVGGGTLTYELDAPAPMSLSILDVRGRVVRQLAHGPADAGTFEVYWDGRSAAGTLVAPGVYFLQLTAADRRAVEKLTITG